MDTRRYRFKVVVYEASQSAYITYIVESEAGNRRAAEDMIEILVDPALKITRIEYQGRSK